MTINPLGVGNSLVYSSIQPYQSIKDSIEENQSNCLNLNREYFKNKNALDLVNKLEADMTRIQNQQLYLQMQLAQLQSRKSWVG